MKTFPRISILIITLGMYASSVWGQDLATDETSFRPHLSIGLFISHAHVFEGQDAEGEHQALSLSSWGLDFNYNVHPRWAIGLHTDVIIEEFKVEGQEGETLEVSYPVAPALMGIYRPGPHWELLLGAGLEVTSEESVFLNRVGVGYTVELSEGWEMAAALTYDLKWEGYDTWLLGLGVIHAFGPKEHGG